MKYLLIGDVHGCCKTLKKMIHDHHINETIIFLGDYIDRGLNVYETIKYLLEIKNRYPDTIILRGNHEQEFIELYNIYKDISSYQNVFKKTYKDLLSYEFTVEFLINLFNSLPLYYENDLFFASHAGASSYPNEDKNPNDPCGILWNRMPLKNLEKLQIHGHTPTISGPLYNEISNSWNLDTGACFNGFLSALKINHEGRVVKIIKVKTLENDIYIKK